MVRRNKRTVSDDARRAATPRRCIARDSCDLRSSDPAFAMAVQALLPRMGCRRSEPSRGSRPGWSRPNGAQFRRGPPPAPNVCAPGSTGRLLACPETAVSSGGRRSREVAQRARKLEEAQATCFGDRFDARRNPELLVDPLDVCLERVGRNEELRRDFLVRESGREISNDGEFAAAERSRRCCRSRSGRSGRVRGDRARPARISRCVLTVEAE